MGESCGGIVRIDGSKGLRVNRHVMGANCGMTNLPHGCKDYNDDEFIALMKACGNPFFRYPGGTVSNYHHPLTGFCVPVDGSKRQQKHLRTNKKILADFGEAGWPSDSFFDMIKQCGNNYSLVLNVFTATVQDNKDFLSKLIQKGHPVDYIEIGNELFFPEYEKVLGGVHQYNKIAYSLSEFIRKHLPGTKIAICIPNHIYKHLFFKGGGPAFVKEWLSETANDSDHYDAVVFHAYSANGVDPENADKIPAFDKAMKDSLGFVDLWLEKVLQFVKEMYPGKEIWITEYGVGDFPPGPLRSEFEVGKRYLGALHNTVFIMKLLRDPEVTMAHWHSMSKFCDGRGKNSKNTAAMKQFSFLNKIITESKTSYPVEFEGLGTYTYRKTELPALEGIFLSRDSDRQGSLLVVNKTATPVGFSQVVWGESGEAAQLVKSLMKILGPARRLSLAEGLGDKIDCDEHEGHLDYCDNDNDIIIPPFAAAVIPTAND